MMAEEVRGGWGVGESPGWAFGSFPVAPLRLYKAGGLPSLASQLQGTGRGPSGLSAEQLPG